MFWEIVIDGKTLAFESWAVMEYSLIVNNLSITFESSRTGRVGKTATSLGMAVTLVTYTKG